jgi:arylsulfatase A-like enzyme
MKKHTRILYTTLTTLLASLASLPAQTVSFNNSDGDWALPANWSSGSLPAAPANAIVGGGRTANVTSVIEQAPNFIRIGNNSTGGTLNVSGGGLSGSHLQVASGVDSVGIVNLSGGTLTTGAFSVASTNSGATASLTLSGGTLNWGTNFNIGTQGNATVTIQGKNQEVYSGANIVIGNGTLIFRFGEDGVASLDASSSLIIGTSATLTVDGSAYQGDGGAYRLITFGSGERVGDFRENTIAEGFGSSKTLIKYNDEENSIDLIVIPDRHVFHPRVRLEGNEVLISFKTANGLNYRLQGSPDLYNWTSHGTIEGTGAVVEQAHPVGTEDRYFMRIDIPLADPPPPDPSTGPNVIVFLADDLGWQDTTLNDVNAPCPWETPNIERLARMGINFPQGYAPAPSCTPTRVALMTGKHPARTGVTHVQGGAPPVGRTSDSHMDPYFPARMEVEEVTIADALRSHGYRTGHIGKWHMAVNHNAYPGPFDQGFTFSSRTRGMHRRMDPDRLSDFATDSVGDPYRIDGDGRPFDAVTEDALSFMEENSEHPFFLYVAHWLVHWPVQTRNRALLEYYSNKLGIPFPTNPGPVTTPGQTNPYYGAMVDTLDWSLGKIIDYLEQTDDPRNPGRKLIENTYILFSSDNGGALRHATEIITTNAPLDKGKTSAKEGGIRVPFVVAGPNIPANRTSQEMVNLLDLYPTILTLTGAPGDPAQVAAFDGADLTPHLFGQTDWVTHSDGTRRDKMFWHFPHIIELHSAIRHNNFKLLKNYATDTYNLFRLYGNQGERRDWEEAIDLSTNSDYLDIRDQLAADLDSYLESLNASLPHKNPAYTRVNELVGGGRIPKFIEQGFNVATRLAYATFENTDRARVEKGILLYTLNGGHTDEEWFPLEANVDQEDGIMAATLPEGATHFLFNLIDRNNFLVSSVQLQHTSPPTPASQFVNPVDFYASGSASSSDPGSAEWMFTSGDGWFRIDE